MSKCYDIVPTPRVVYATLPDGIGANVIVNGVAVYSEDADKGCHNVYMSALTIARQLAKTLSVPLLCIPVSLEEAGGEEWTHDGIVETARRKAPSSADSCDNCGAVNATVGCPNGKQICQACFDAGFDGDTMPE